ncbi:M23 family metallopeptidase [Saccharopolyspora endophytica]|nr:M23 family metallopeptidase [Saccharopolyspora endophytica]
MSKVLLLLAAVVIGFPLMVVAVAGAAITSIFAARQTSSSTCLVAGADGITLVGYGPEETRNAATIVAVGKQLHVPEQGQVVAIATALRESWLRNLTWGDRDSLGLFQQRPSMGWGTREEILNPVYSSTQFYTHLLAVPGWKKMRVTDAADAVQKSALPEAYAEHEAAARAIVAALHGAHCQPAPASGGGWVVPTTGTCTSGYGPRNGEMHRGQDIAAPIRTPILAAHTGTVIDSGPASGYGLWVRIEHPGGIITVYGHNNVNHVHVGDRVQAGQAIAEVGNRGESTGAHLHFQIEDNGQPVDPVAFYHDRGHPSLCGEAEKRN